MNESQDYGEPLTASFPADSQPRIWYSDGDLCAIVEGNLGLGINDADMARRLVACVNAMRGVADPEAFVKAADDLAQLATFCPPMLGNILTAYRVARGKR